MQRYRSDFQFSISPSACVLAAMIVLILPMRWIFSAFFAAAFHEACHALAVYLCGEKVERLSVGDRETVMHTGNMPAGKALLCILAGPFGSLLLVFFVRWIPRIAFCALVHSSYNLLPIYPLDGGRAIRCILPEKICNIIQTVFLALIWILAIYLSVFKLFGLFPLVIAFAMWQLKNRP